MSIERDPLPRPWPFLSTDPRMVEATPPDVCRCTHDLTFTELECGECATCGKAVLE